MPLNYALKKEMYCNILFLIKLFIIFIYYIIRNTIFCDKHKSLIILLINIKIK